MCSQRTVREELNVRIIRHYAEQGQLCKLGWTAFQAGIQASGITFSEHERVLMRDAFYMGIQHCYASMMQTVGEDEGNEEADFKIMKTFTDELHEFLQDFMVRHEVFAKANHINLADMEQKKSND
jgi:hypothetical protein